MERIPQDFPFWYSWQFCTWSSDSCAELWCFKKSHHSGCCRRLAGVLPALFSHRRALEDAPKSSEPLQTLRCSRQCRIVNIAESMVDSIHCGPGSITPSISPGITAPEIETTGEEMKTPLYRVVLLDDDDHTYDYVIEMLQKIFIFTAEQALRHAQEVDSVGRTVLITCELPQAEFARDQVQSYGRDWRLPRSKGSMSAVIEPVSGSG